MCHGQGCIIILDLLSDTRFVTLKHIDTICSKTQKLASKLISRHASPYGQCLHGHFGQIFETKSFQKPINGNQNKDPYPIFHHIAMDQ